MTADACVRCGGDTDPGEDWTEEHGLCHGCHCRIADGLDAPLDDDEAEDEREICEDCGERIEPDEENYGPSGVFCESCWLDDRRRSDRRQVERETLAEQRWELPHDR